MLDIIPYKAIAGVRYDRVRIQPKQQIQHGRILYGSSTNVQAYQSLVHIHMQSIGKAGGGVYSCDASSQSATHHASHIVLHTSFLPDAAMHSHHLVP